MKVLSRRKAVSGDSQFNRRASFPTLAYHLEGWLLLNDLDQTRFSFATENAETGTLAHTIDTRACESTAVVVMQEQS